jgi:hypothetical protein
MQAFFRTANQPQLHPRATEAPGNIAPDPARSAGDHACPTVKCTHRPIILHPGLHAAFTAATI